MVGVGVAVPVAILTVAVPVHVFASVTVTVYVPPVVRIGFCTGLRPPLHAYELYDPALSVSGDPGQYVSEVSVMVGVGAGLTVTTFAIEVVSSQ
jgi:hypothetical protein